MSEINHNEHIKEQEDLMPKGFEKEFPKKHKNQSVSMAVWFGVVFGVAASVFVGWNVIAPKLKKVEQTEVPLIKRSTAPVKVKPSDPGGMDIPNRDRRVYARIESGNDEPVVEKLLPPPEQPIAPEVNVINEQEKEYVFDNKNSDEESLEQLIEEVKNSEGNMPQVEEKEEITVTEESKPDEAVKTIVEEKKVTVTEKKPEPPKVVETPKKAEPKPEVKIEPTTPKTIVKEPVVAGEWKVQILSVKDEEAAEKAWDTLSKKYSSILSGVAHFVEKADLGTKGIFYRLKVGGYAERSKADDLCAKLKAQKQGCLVVK